MIRNQLLKMILLCVFACLSLAGQAQISTIDGVYLEKDDKQIKITQDTIQGNSVLVFDIPGVNEYIASKGILLENIRLVIQNVELDEFPAFLTGTDDGLLSFQYSEKNLTTAHRKVLYNLPGAAKKSVLVGVKFNENLTLTYGYRGNLYFSNIKIWSRVGYIFIGLFFVFFLLLILYYKSIVKDDISMLGSNAANTVSASYSFSKSQLAYWTFIVLASFIYIFALTEDISSINATALILLGISATTGTISHSINKKEERQARATDAANPAPAPAAPVPAAPPAPAAAGAPAAPAAVPAPAAQPATAVSSLREFRTTSGNFFEDILSDSSGVNIHRVQALVFNLVFGIAFVKTVIVDYSMPEFSELQLGLLGLSNGTYAFVKNSENT